jgi:1A family penicillin-binding protein
MVCAALLLGVLIVRPSLLLPLPSLDAIHSRRLAPSSLILDRQGRLLYEIVDPHTGLHRPIPLGEIPLALRQAVIATEDATFYHNPGVNLRGIVRALWLNLRSGAVVSGGSTITQQLARNLLLEPEARLDRSLWRKAREAVMAYHLTRSLSKDEILELYLNETYFGSMAYGVEAAARAYFGKPVSQLDLAECALIAGLPQAPGRYNPLTDLPAAKARQQVVLQLMAKTGYISVDEAERAHREPLHLGSSAFSIEAPHFSMLVRQKLSDLVGEDIILQGGLRIHTTLDLPLQRDAEAQVRRQLSALNESSPQRRPSNANNAAVLVLDPKSGDVLAMVGSPSYFDAAIDGAVNASLALRQPGSALKPLTYAAAFAQGYSPATVLSDVRTAFVTREGDPYVPVNYDRRFHGPVSLRQALGSSYNVVAVKLLDQIGISSLPDMARRLGITSLNDEDRHGLAMTLGGVEVSLWELTRAYAILANGGNWAEPRLIMSVEDATGRIVYQAPVAPSRQALDARIAYLVTDVLVDSDARRPAFGTGSALDLPYPAAVKTGTTGEWRDNWTVGYTAERAVGVWVGNADNSPMVNVSGVSGAAPIWNAVMRSAHATRPTAFEEPDGLVRVAVCPESGLLPADACSHTREELFLASAAPQARCTTHRYVTLDAVTGALADASTPTERRVMRRVTVWPADARLWAAEEGLLSPLAEQLVARDASAVQGGSAAAAAPATPARPPIELLSPHPNSVFAISSAIPLQSQQLEIVAALSYDLSVSQVSLYVDDQVWHIWEEPPYRVMWPLQVGRRSFFVMAMDRARGLIQSPTVSIQVDPDVRREGSVVP